MGVESVGHQLKLSIRWNEGYCSVIFKPGKFIRLSVTIHTSLDEAFPMLTWTDEHTGGT